jgi:hypothetical protein
MSITLLIDWIIAATGLTESDVRLIARYLREAGMLPKASRQNLPQIESVHAAILLLANMVGGPQLRVADTVRRLWAMPLAYTEKPGAAVPGTSDDLTFGQRILQYIEDAADEDRSKDFAKRFHALNVSQRHPYAAIMHQNGQTEHFIDPNTPPMPKHRAPISAVSIAGPDVLVELAKPVVSSRAEAGRMGVTIPVAEAWKALGSAPIRKSPAPPIPPRSSRSAAHASTR